MQTLIVEDLEDDVVARITRLATANRLSIEEQAKLLLSQASRYELRADRTSVLEAIAALTPKGVDQTDSVEMLREDRNR